MEGEIKKSNGSWANFVTLKDYIDAQLEQRDKAVIAALASNEKRLDSMNEFRNTLRDQNQTFTTRREHSVTCVKNDQRFEELKDEMTKLSNQISNMQAKLWIILSVGGVAVGWFIMHLIDKL